MIALSSQASIYWITNDSGSEAKELAGQIAERRSRFLAAAIAHSQVYCQELSEHVTRVLPREIREMIYGHLCTRMIRISVMPSRRAEEGLSYIKRLETPLPYLFSRKYLTESFLTELVSVLYAKVTFHIWDAADLNDFLNQDFFGLGVLPKDHVRKLSLVIFTDQWDQRCSSKRQITQKLAHLRQLFEVKHQQGSRLDLHLCISQHYQRPTVARFHQFLLPYMYDFREAGFTLRLPLKKYHYKHRKVDRSEMNQLQSSSSTDPEDWIVDDEELEEWAKSVYIQNAFKRSASHLSRFVSDYDSEPDIENEVWDGEAPASDSEDEGVDDDDEVPFVEDDIYEHDEEGASGE
ncbi:hypothetical protein BU23DRAFT_13174 [Bimuria novae-zelandiae CBS 107.79]|uniref:Uncharacterized protein n=1 Tax=Bimuria novae-zelandiae CBS 107.79 TaxID=1447943 RepID=A0A6A5VI10_9PLEO|nr:hypothetical protein BU23DRAFT_13174 [Bimuria novae-zelandiae CBS 107.79]